VAENKIIRRTLAGTKLKPGTIGVEYVMVAWCNDLRPTGSYLAEGGFGRMKRQSMSREISGR
jgi:hypothetical protein